MYFVVFELVNFQTGDAAVKQFAGQILTWLEKDIKSNMAN